MKLVESIKEDIQGLRKLEKKSDGIIKKNIVETITLRIIDYYESDKKRVNYIKTKDDIVFEKIISTYDTIKK